MTEQDPQPETPAREVTTTLNRPFISGYVLTLGGLLAVATGFAFTQLSTVLIYIAFALFAALGLDPIVRYLVKKGIRRGWGIVIVYVLFAMIVVGIVLLVMPTVISQIAQVVTDAPKLLKDFESSDAYRWIHTTIGSEASTLVHDVTTFFTQPSHIAALGQGVFKVGVSIVSSISGVIIVLVLSLYFLAALPQITTGFNRIFPAHARSRVASMTVQITDSVGNYLSGMVVLAFCNAVVALILHLAVGLPFALLMAVVAFVLTLIPLVGSVMYWVLATVLALFTGWLPALLFAVLYLVYMQIEAYLLTPKVMNRAIAVPGSLVVIGALVGGTLLGLLGALIAIPVTASILLIVKQVLIPKQDSKLVAR